MSPAITNIIASLTAFLLLFFSVFLLFNKKGRRQSNLLLSAFLFSNALYIIDFLLRQYPEIFIKSIPGFFYIGYSFGFLFGPLLYLYTSSLVYFDFSFRKIHLTHFILFGISLLLFFFSFHIYSSGSQVYLLTERKILSAELWFLVNLTMNIQIPVYMILCLKIISFYSQEIKKQYSSIKEQNLNWLKIIVLAFLFMWLMDLFLFIIVKAGVHNIELNRLIVFFSLMINFVFANAIIFNNLYSPGCCSGIEQEEGKKYLKSTLGEDEKENIAGEVKKYIETQKAFLNPNISLAELSSALEINPKYISQVINEKLNKNFFELINSYRIEYAKSLMKEPERKTDTVLEILYESGFNSKSVFNTVFKKYTGMTPTQFKRSA